jgi:hypothetical protein
MLSGVYTVEFSGRVAEPARRDTSPINLNVTTHAPSVGRRVEREGGHDRGAGSALI